MKDRYLYKAKRLDNGEWVQGYYVKGLDMYDKEIHLIFEPATSFYSHGETAGWHEVIPDTICQCTGLKDDNGTPIFENDMLSLTDKVNDYEWKAVVKFGNPNAEYAWGWWLIPLTKCDANKDILLWIETELNTIECRVIGNIFSNKELLESEE